MISEHVIHERSKNIPIKQNLTTKTKNVSPKGEYSLKQSFFDPSKSSPPNEFLLKLQMRMLIYNSDVHMDTKDDMRDNE